MQSFLSSVVAKLFAKQSAAEVAVGATYYQGYGRSMSGLSFQEAVNKGYKGLVWVRRCIMEMSKAVGSVPWRAYKLNPTTRKVVWLPDHPLQKLMAQPNPYYTRGQFMEAFISYLTLAGNCYIEIVGVGINGRTPKELYMIRPDWITPVPDKTSYLKGYKLDTGAYKADLDPPQILHFKYLDPMNEYIGISPLGAAARTIATEDSAIAWNKTIFDNSAVPSGILKIPGTGMAKKEDREKVRNELDGEFNRQNRHRPMVLWGGMEWEKMSLDAKDLDFLNMLQKNKMEICAICEVPPAIVGANPDPTYANYDVARTAMWEDNVIPKLEYYQDKINSEIASRFDDNVKIMYDLSNVPAMRASFGSKVETAYKIWQMGYPINMINTRVGLGFPEVPWGDAWWAQMNLMPVTSAEVSSEVEEGETEVEETEPAEEY